MLNRSLLYAAAVLFTAIAIEHAPAVWRGPPQMLAALDDETRDWGQSPYKQSRRPMLRHG